MKKKTFSASALAVGTAIALALGFVATPATAVDPCALPNVQVASGDGIGGTGAAGDSDGIGGSGHTGNEDGIGGTGFASRDGIGGTGAAGDEDGVGGTGHTGDGEEDGVGGSGFANTDGIGGTGLSGDDGVGGTGIWGTITNFGSICVNGLRVEYNDKTRILRNGQPTEAAALHRGQVVWVEATAQTSGLVANRISAVSATIGRLVAVDKNTRRLRVGDQTVWAPHGIAWAGLPASAEPNFAALQPGDTVDVSGLRSADGTIVATRIVRSSEAQPDYEGPRLATLVRESPRVKQLSVEGFTGPESPESTVRVSGITVEGSRFRRLTPESRVWVAGPRQGAVGMDARKVLYRPLQRPSANRLRKEDAQLWREQISEDPAPQVIETGTPPVTETPTRSQPPEPADIRTAPTASKPAAISIDRSSGTVAKPDTPTRVETTNRPQTVDRPPKKPERPDRIQRPPTKPERPERIERPESIERPERIERPTAIK